MLTPPSVVKPSLRLNMHGSRHKEAIRVPALYNGVAHDDEGDSDSYEDEYEEEEEGEEGPSHPSASLLLFDR